MSADVYINVHVHNTHLDTQYMRNIVHILHTHV